MISITDLCNKTGMSRQNYYAKRVRRKKEKIEEDFILELVKRERKLQSRLGTRKLLFLLKTELENNGISIGRDRLFELLRNNKLLVKKKKGKPRTTNSRHTLPVFKNLIKDIEITRSNQAWCSDLTYIRTEEGFMYASLITDMYSRKIVGAYIGDTLEAYGCIEALKRALRRLPKGSKPIHHSDRGTQYCCHGYVNLLDKSKLRVSMTEENHCYENAMAERVNGILKQEYELDVKFKNKKQAKAAFYQGVELYNTRRPHMSLNYRIPTDVHRDAA